MVAPDFNLLDQQGKIQHLSDYKGKWVVVYFYPKDNTPLCTKEACEFRNQWENIEKINAVVLGISMDTVESHKNFAEKYDLHFPLLSDESGNTAKDYKAWAPSLIPGFSPIKRITYLINPEGEIAKVYKKVDPLLHAEEIIKEIKKQSTN